MIPCLALWHDREQVMASNAMPPSDIRSKLSHLSQNHSWQSSVALKKIIKRLFLVVFLDKSISQSQTQCNSQVAQHRLYLWKNTKTISVYEFHGGEKHLANNTLVLLQAMF